MADLVVVVGVIVFFAVAAVFVAACDRIIGPDPAPSADVEGDRAGAVAESVR